jgi:hypothetical protein
MKSIMLIVTIALLLFATAGEAQITATPKAATTMYKMQLANAKTYAASQTDTLPSPSATSNTVPIGGATFASLRMAMKDSGACDIYVDKRVRYSGTTATSWSTILTDSCVNTSGAGANGGKTQEYLLRSGITDLIVGLQVEMRVRVAWRAGFTAASAGTYTLDLNWKP